jgi:glycosyltransferase involved in cell wall biosynthesis
MLMNPSPDWPSQCAAVIPCFNEAGAVAAVVRAVREQLPQVFVVDDGSADATAERAGAAEAQVIREPVNRGKGAALRRGLERARATGFTWALCLDGDGQHAASDIPRFLECAVRTGAPLVVGNRMDAPGDMPWLRRAVNRWMSRRLSHLAGRELPDTQCGFRLVRLDAWAALSLRAERFEAESEWLLAFAEAGHPIEFVPVQVIYRDERSKIQPLRDAWRWLRWVQSRPN